ncbi:hypothetical protein THRCLA_02016 [Thraustotheca clavata]|uniref:Riboflavin synthase n=1 Tax=Thraustotheca clavata TaxID=74557 RepID=A0A1W0A6Q4_9STRA|nr:hypothetical protein THRCLA_02016 [Thraustotheca clavata]
MLLVSAIMAGMLMGYMSIDKLNILILTMEGNDIEKAQAARILPIINQSHNVLVSLLLVNAGALEALPIWLNRIVPESTAILFSVTFVLMFGEILPSAIFTGKNQLAIAAAVAPLCHFVMAIMCPIAWPICKVLDVLIGESNDITQYKRKELKALIRLQQSSSQINPILPSTKSLTTSSTSSPTSSISPGACTSLQKEEVNILHGALDMSKKSVIDIATPFEDVFMLDGDALLNFELMVDILACGYSRIPVFLNHRPNIIGLLLVKRLIVIDSDAERPIKNLTLRKPLVVSPDYSCYAMLNQFQIGKGQFALITQQAAYVEACWKANFTIDPSYVTIQGVITIENILEELLQEEIQDETDIIAQCIGQDYPKIRRQKLRESGMRRAAKVFKALATRVRRRLRLRTQSRPSPSTPLLILWTTKMFTGIIEEMGTCVELVEKNDMVMWDGSVSSGVVLVVEATLAFEGAYIGCSIAINGTCLTVTEIDETTHRLSFGVAPESLRKTNLKSLKSGDKVNVERAMGAHDRNSGHFVQGHVDGTGDIIDMTREGDSLWIKIKVDKNLMEFIIPKGFIAIDGTSLTVCEVNQAAGWFNVMLITHTQNSIILPTKKVGDAVNIEGDVMGKYAAKSTGALVTRLEVLEKSQTKSLLAAGIVGGAIGACLAFVVAQK